VRVPTSVPGAPPVIKALSGTRGGPLTAKVVWGDPAYTGGLRVVGYKVIAVKVLRNGTSGKRSAQTVGAGHRSLKVRLPGGKYRFLVRAVNDQGAGAAGRSPVAVAR